MSSFLELFATIFRKHVPEPSELQNSFTDLPQELIRHIAQYLPSASAAAMTYSCRSLLTTLGTRYWQELQAADKRQELSIFLQLLQTDLPDHVLCSHCLKLYSIHSYTPHRGSSRACKLPEFLGGVCVYVHPMLEFSAVQIIMERYRQGLKYSHLLENFNSKTASNGSIENFPYQFMSKANIVRRDLLLRVQELLLFPDGLPRRMPFLGRLMICTHVGPTGRGFEARLPEHMPCTLDHSHSAQDQCVRSSGTRQCVYCPTEFQIGLHSCGARGVAVVVTKWLDLGQGRTALDPKWWSRLATAYTGHEVFMGRRGVFREKLRGRLPVPSDRASIRADFEHEEDLQLTAERLDELSQMLGQGC